MLASLHEYRNVMTEQEYANDRKLYLYNLTAFPRISPATKAVFFLVCVAVLAALAASIKAGSIVWSSVAAVLLICITVPAYAFSRYLARWRRLTKPERLAAIDRLLARELVSTEEASLLRSRIEVLFGGQPAP